MIAINPQRETWEQAADPTPDQIRVACARIRSTWSDTERLKRAGYDPKRYPRVEVPYIRLADITFSETGHS